MWLKDIRHLWYGIVWSGYDNGMVWSYSMYCITWMCMYGVYGVYGVYGMHLNIIYI